MRNIRVVIWSAVLLSTILFASTLSFATGVSCEESLHSKPVGAFAAQDTAASIRTAFPSVGISYANDTFVFQATNSKQTSGSFDFVRAALAAYIAALPEGHGSLDIYFSGLSTAKAMNIVSNARLQAAAKGREVEGLLSEAGGGGRGLPPTADGVAAAAGAGGEPPSPNGGKGGAGDGGGDGEAASASASDPWRAAAAFRKMEKRYDWNKAEVADLTDAPTRPASEAVPDGFLANPYEFKVSIPKSQPEATPDRFQVLVFFKTLIRPQRAAVQDTIQSTLHEEALKRATLRQAASRVVSRVESHYSGSKALMGMKDLGIVAIEVSLDAG